MIVLIGQLTGISDIGALIGIAGANIAMILFGWLMEGTNDRDRGVSRLPFLFGCVAGAVPWIAIAVAVAGSEIEHGGAPGFVYGILASLFARFNSFAVNQYLQCAQIGRWCRYVTGEWGYLALSLTAKSILAWQVFANTLLS